MTKTSNLLLLTILIGVSVTSAYAITITLGADPVNVLGDLNVDGTINIFGLLPDDQDRICFDEVLAPKCLRWRDGSDDFLFDRSLFVGGDLAAEGTVNADFLKSFGNTIVDGDLDLRGTSSTDNDTILFDNVVESTQTLEWDNSQSRFEFSSALALSGPIQTGSNTVAPAFYNRMGIATADHTADISFNNDLLISGNLEVDGPAFFDSDLSISGFLNVGSPSTLIIATGVVTATSSYHIIAAESATADSLTNILGGTIGDIIIITPDAGDTITVDVGPGTGGIRTESGGSHILMDSDQAVFIFDGTNWLYLFDSNPQA